MVTAFPRRNILARCALAAGVLLLAPQSSLGQTAPEPSPTAATQQELDAKRDALIRAKNNETRIRAEIEAISSERARLAADLIDTASRLKATETRMADSEEKLEDLAASEKDVRTALQARQGVITELLAALERLGRNPPPALLVRPDDALTSARSAVVLGGVLPQIQRESEALSADLSELTNVLRASEAERNRLEREKADLEAGRLRIALLVEARQTRLGERAKALTEEQQRSMDLAKDVKSLEELITRMESEVASARQAAEAAKAAAERRSSLASLNDPSRLAPAVPFIEAKGRLPYPVAGVRVREFDEADGVGGKQKGVSFSTRAGAQVTAPSDGWVVYAGPFRSYGQLLILNAGSGYHILLAGMTKISVDVGQFVVAGEPVAEMGAGTGPATVLNAGFSQPVLYVEFRKDGTSIDPGPWWARQSAEKVRG